MRGLTIIVAAGDPARLRAALETAAAQAALGGRARLFLHGDAAPLLRSNEPMLAEALALGAAVTVCQSGLARSDLSAADLPPGVDTGGMVSLLATLGDDRLLMA